MDAERCRRSSIWVSCMTPAKAFPKTMPRRCDGIAWPPSRDLPRRSQSGYMYNTGEGVPQNDTEAVRWFRMAAEQGFADGAVQSGFMYDAGEGVPQNDAEAVRWYRMAAEQGFAEAQFNLGFMYDTGRGVPQNDAEAVRWYRMAAEQGFASAQLNLGYMYSNGEGVPKRCRLARWYRMALCLGAVQSGSHVLPRQRDGARHAKAQVQSGFPHDERKRWYRSAEQGFAMAQVSLGLMYALGEGVPKDDVQAYAWVNIAAAQGDEKAKENFGNHHKKNVDC